MRKALQVLLFFASVISCLSYSASAQPSDTVNVHIKVLEVGIQDIYKRVDPIFKFYLGSENGELLNARGVCYDFYSKEPTNSFSFPLPDAKKAGWENLKTLSIPILSQQEIVIVMESYIDIKGEKCTFDKKDEFHAIAKKVIDLTKFTPGDFSDTLLLADPQGHYWSKIQLRYSLLAPQSIKTTEALKQVNAADKSFQLLTSYKLPNREKLKFGWEVSKDKGGSWRRLEGESDNPLQVKFSPYKDLFDEKMQSNENLLFRVKVNSRDTATYSETLAISLTPPAPFFNKEDIVVENTCKGVENGKLLINNIQSFTPKVSFILRRSTTNKSRCDFRNSSSANCPGFIRTGVVMNGTIDIKELAPGAYNLLVFNSDIDVEDVYVSQDFEIKEYPELAITNTLLRNPNCKDENGGEIRLAIQGGGKRESWQLEFSPYKPFEQNGDRLNFKGLPEAQYTLEITDGCGAQLTKVYPLRKPESLQIENIRGQKNGGQISLILNLKNGSGRYSANISTAGGLAKTIDSLPNNILPIEFPGIIHIRLVDKSDPECLFVDTTLRIDPSGLPLPINKNAYNKSASYWPSFKGEKQSFLYIREEFFAWNKKLK